MAIAANKQAKNTDFKKYTGYVPLQVKLNVELDKEYTGVDEEGNAKLTVPFEFFDPKLKIRVRKSVFIVDRPLLSFGAPVFINSIGVTMDGVDSIDTIQNWAEDKFSEADEKEFRRFIGLWKEQPEDIDKAIKDQKVTKQRVAHNFLYAIDEKGNKVARKVRECKDGEQVLYHLLDSYLNLDKRAAENELELESFKKLMKGNFKELETIFKTMDTDPSTGKKRRVSVLLGVNDKGYQDIYTPRFTRWIYPASVPITSRMLTKFKKEAGKDNYGYMANCQGTFSFKEYDPASALVPTAPESVIQGGVSEATAITETITSEEDDDLPF